MRSRPNPLVAVSRPPAPLVLARRCRRCRRAGVRLSATRLCPACRERLLDAA